MEQPAPVVEPEKALVEVEERAPARTLLDVAPEEFSRALERRAMNRAALIGWVRSALVEGVDFGRIPTKRGASKPSLFKPGSEKIVGMLGVTAVFPTLGEYERAALEGRTIEQVILRCHMVAANGQTLADGVGARSLDQDGGDLNKALKMAAKSAMIDATLRLAGLSEVFTQDIEDMNLDPRGEGWKRQDRKLVRKRAEEIRACFAGEDGEVKDGALTQVLGELASADPDFKIAVWNELPRAQRDYIRIHHSGES
jgi:hypothetical protein